MDCAMQDTRGTIVGSIFRRAPSAKQVSVAIKKSSWIVSDIESFRSPFQWDAIVVVESIYYSQLTALSRVLRRISSMRPPDGSLVVRVHDTEKHREYINELYRVLPTTRKIGDRLFSAGSGESFESSVRATDAAAN
jgi:hypothetical protein